MMLFASTCNQPLRLKEALEPVRGTLVAKAPVARWGLAYVQSGEVLLSRSPRQSETDVDLYSAVAEVASDYVVAHAVRPGAPEAEWAGTANTQPFRFRRWMLAQQGSIGHYAQVAPQLLEQVPDYMRRNVKGRTPAELFFHVFLAMLHDLGSVDDPNLPITTTRRAIAAALGLVLDRVTKAGGGETPGNLVVSNGRSMLAVRLGGPMYTRRLTVLGPRGERDESFRGVMVLSTDTPPGEGFEEVPQRSGLAIGRDLRTDIAVLEG
jgi:predicted glutamine amidotransferase